MATVLDFRQAARASTRRERDPVAGSGGEVVIFPGVRYEYHDGQSAGRSRRGRLSVQRDRLELELAEEA